MAKSAIVFRRKRYWILAAVLAVLHLILAFATFEYAFGESMASFDTGEDPSGWLYVLCDRVSAVLWQPAAVLLEDSHLPRALAWAALLANSAFWGGSLTFAWYRLRPGGLNSPADGRVPR